MQHIIVETDEICLGLAQYCIILWKVSHTQEQREKRLCSCKKRKKRHLEIGTIEAYLWLLKIQC